MEEHEIMEQALEAKRNGDFYSAISSYGALLEIDKHSIEGYYGLGKVYYLLGDYDAAIRHLIIAQHLRMLAFADNPSSMVLVKELPAALRKKAEKIAPDAVYILIDMNTPRHLAHALFDYSSLAQDRAEHIAMYRDEITGIAVNEDEAYKAEEQDFYYTMGVDIALNLIDFKCNENDIIDYYLSDFADFKDILRRISEKGEKPEQ